MQFIPVRTKKDFDELLAQFSQADVVAWDTETTSTDARVAELVGISLSFDGHTGYYIPLGHIIPSNTPEGTETTPSLFDLVDVRQPDQLLLEDCRAELTRLFSDSTKKFVCHNAKYDMTMLYRYLHIWVDTYFDTMIASHFLSDGQSAGLKERAWIHLEHKMKPITDLIGTGKTQIPFSHVLIEDALPYAADDAIQTYRLYEVLQAKITTLNLRYDIFNYELRLLKYVAMMDMHGTVLDVDGLLDYQKLLFDYLQDLQKEMLAIVENPTLNLNSGQQLSTALFTKLGLPTTHSWLLKDGRTYSTNGGVLAALEELDETGFVTKLLNYKSVHKVLSTYVNAWLWQYNKQTNRIYPSFNQTGTVTGRFASHNPNFQNIPSRTEHGQALRKFLIAPPGYVLFAADYSQVELRIVAHIANDAMMIQAFRSGEDIHATTAASVYGIPLEMVVSAQRRFAKTVNFGLIYGQGAWGLHKSLRIPYDEAQEFINTYFARFVGVANYINSVPLLVAKSGYIATLCGRRRYFPILAKPQPDRYDPLSGMWNKQRRDATNHPIQGTAADIMKMAMVDVGDALVQGDHGDVHITAQVHDEIIAEIPEHKVDEVAPLIISKMQDAFSLVVPLKVDYKIGRSWFELKE